MFAPEFDYRKANTVAEAIDLLAANPGAKAMAGGHSLIPLMKLRLSRPPLVVDIGGIAEMKGISVDNGSIRIGALTTHWEIESSPDVQAANSLLAEVAGGIGDTQVRNRGTIGGNLSHADPASDWGTALTALGATLEIQGPGGASRTVTPTEFILGPLTVALGENELLTSITVPDADGKPAGRIRQDVPSRLGLRRSRRRGGGDGGRERLHGSGHRRRRRRPRPDPRSIGRKRPDGPGIDPRKHRRRHRPSRRRPGRRHHRRLLRLRRIPPGNGRGGDTPRPLPRHGGGAPLIENAAD